MGARPGASSEGGRCALLRPEPTAASLRPGPPAPGHSPCCHRPHAAPSSRTLTVCGTQSQSTRRHGCGSLAGTEAPREGPGAGVSSQPPPRVAVPQAGGHRSRVRGAGLTGSPGRPSHRVTGQPCRVCVGSESGLIPAGPPPAWRRRGLQDRRGVSRAGAGPGRFFPNGLGWGAGARPGGTPPRTPQAPPPARGLGPMAVTPRAARSSSRGGFSGCLKSARGGTWERAGAGRGRWEEPRMPTTRSAGSPGLREVPAGPCPCARLPPAPSPERVPSSTGRPDPASTSVVCGAGPPLTNLERVKGGCGTSATEARGGFSAASTPRSQGTGLRGPAEGFRWAPLAGLCPVPWGLSALAKVEHPLWIRAPPHKDNRAPPSPRDPVTQARSPPFWATLTKASVPAGWPSLGQAWTACSRTEVHASPGGLRWPRIALSGLGPWRARPFPGAAGSPRSRRPAPFPPPISAWRGLASLLDSDSGLKSRHLRGRSQGPARRPSSASGLRGWSPRGPVQLSAQPPRLVPGGPV